MARELADAEKMVDEQTSTEEGPTTTAVGEGTNTTVAEGEEIITKTGRFNVGYKYVKVRVQ